MAPIALDGPPPKKIACIGAGYVGGPTMVSMCVRVHLLRTHLPVWISTALC